jgi:hypothetical protein
MTHTYTVMIRHQDPETALFIPQKISWFGFFAPVLWGISQGLVLFTLIILGIGALAAFFLPFMIFYPFIVIFHLFMALEAPFFQEKAKQRLGYTPYTSIFADSLNEAEEKFFHTVLQKPWSRL